jgi:hypothetical protein
MMDNFELKTEPKVKRKSIIWNILTILVLLGTCYLAYYFITIFVNPSSVHNPFPPVSLPTLFQTATNTPTLIPKPPTWTPTGTMTPVPTRTKAPTWTLVKLVTTPSATMTPTASPIPGTPTITPTAMTASATITYEASTTIHPDLACDWMGVGGKVLDAENKPLLFQTIQLGGSLNGETITDIVISGTNPAYGTSGFEFKKLGDAPIVSTHTLWIQLFDNNGKPLTEKIFFDTSADCAKNLVMVVFTKAR